MVPDYHVFIGAFTREYRSNAGATMGAPADGIEVFRFDGHRATLEHVDSFPGLLSPSFLALHPILPVLYAAERFWTKKERASGAITSFSIDDATGHLEMTSRVLSLGNSPAHVSVHPSGSHAYAAHYEGGNVVAFPLDDHGHVLHADISIFHEGSGPHARQQAPHPHQVSPEPRGNFVHVMDLGIDAIFTYPTGRDGQLARTPSNSVVLPPGTGPRHFARHPNGKIAFVSGEINSTLCVLGYDEKHGGLEFLSAQSTLPEDFDGQSSTAEVICHPSGRVIYVSNRGHDSLSVFSFDATTGSVEFLGTQPTFGHFPRNFTIDPTGRFLIAANQMPGNLVVFTLNPETLWPEPTDFTLDVPSPSCVLFRSIRHS